MPSKKKKDTRRIRFKEESDVYPFRTKPTFELTGEEEPFLESQMRELSSLSWYLQDDVNEMLEPVSTQMEPCVGCAQDMMIHLDWIPFFARKKQERQRSMVGGGRAPSSLAAVARGDVPYYANPYKATNLISSRRKTTKSGFDEASESSDSISRMTPPRGNLSATDEKANIKSQLPKSSTNQKVNSQSSLKKSSSLSSRRQNKQERTRPTIPGRESTDKMKRRLMKPKTEKTVFEKFSDAERLASVNSEGKEHDNSSTTRRVFLIPESNPSPPSTTDENVDVMNVNTNEATKKETQHTAPEPTATNDLEEDATKTSKGDDMTSHLAENSTSGNEIETRRNIQTASDQPTPEESPSPQSHQKAELAPKVSTLVSQCSEVPEISTNQHIPSGTRPESPIRLLSFQDLDDDIHQSDVESTVSEDEIIVIDNVLLHENLVGAAESAIAAAELALQSAGRITVCEAPVIPIQVTEQSSPVQQVSTNGEATSTAPTVDPVVLVQKEPSADPAVPLFAEQKPETREEESSIAENKDEREPISTTPEKIEVTDDGDRDPAMPLAVNDEATKPSSPTKKRGGTRRKKKVDQKTAFSSSFLDAVQSSHDTGLSRREKHAIRPEPLLVSRRYLSDIDTSEDESDTSGHVSSTTYSRESYSYSDYTSQWDNDTSRHSYSSHTYWTDGSSVLFSDERGGPYESSDIGNSSSMETTDREGSTDEEYVPISRPKRTGKSFQEGLSSAFRSRPLLPPRFRATPKSM